MPAFRKIPLLGDEQMPDPRLVLHRAPSEKIVEGTHDILDLLRTEGIAQEGRTRARNPITHGECSFVVRLAQNHETLVALSVALVPAIIAWLKSRKGRKVEIQKGNLKVSAPTEKALAAALKSLAKYEKFTINVNKAEIKRKKQRAKSNDKIERD